MCCGKVAHVSRNKVGKEIGGGVAARNIPTGNHLKRKLQVAVMQWTIEQGIILTLTSILQIYPDFP